MTGAQAQAHTCSSAGPRDMHAPVTRRSAGSTRGCTPEDLHPNSLCSSGRQSGRHAGTATAPHLRRSTLETRHDTAPGAELHVACCSGTTATHVASAAQEPCSEWSAHAGRSRRRRSGTIDEAAEGANVRTVSPSITTAAKAAAEVVLSCLTLHADRLRAACCRRVAKLTGRSDRRDQCFGLQRIQQKDRGRVLQTQRAVTRKRPRSLQHEQRTSLKQQTNKNTQTTNNKQTHKPTHTPT